MNRQGNLYTLLEDSAINNPNKTVIIDRDKSISNQQLKNKVLALSKILKDKGIKKGDFIGVHLKPSIDLVSALLAIAKIGAVFVPLETSLPKERLAFMGKDAGINCLITADSGSGIEQIIGCKEVSLYDISLAEIEEKELDNVSSKPKDTCYVIYTSGTTGQPKGVLVNLAGAMNTITQSAITMDISPSHRLLQLSPISFDVFFLEVGMTLYSGATIVIVDNVDKRSLEKTLIKYNIQHMLCTPNFVTEADLNKTPLHTVMFGGESMPGTLVDKYLGKFNIVHAYGITEATICSTLELCDGTYPVPIGQPLKNTYLEILDYQQNPVDVNVPGEIVLSGIGISNGYIGRSDLDHSRFIGDPDRQGEKRFRTGDMAKRDKEGNIFFLGRNDRQIKYREHRLEMFEVESILLNHAKIDQSAVLLSQDQLWAFVSVIDKEVTDREITDYLRLHYPEELIPRIKILDNMPLTNHNKVNYSKLKEVLM